MSTNAAPSFAPPIAGTGKLTTDIGTDSYDNGRSITVQSDGKILVGGYSDSGGSYDFALVRYNPDGSLDTSFNAAGTPGKLITDIGTDSSDIGSSITVQIDGKILAGGYSDSGGSYDFALVRYNPDGSLDTSFNAAGTPGKLVTDIGVNSYDRGRSITLQSDGKILVGGETNIGGSTNFTVARYNTDGSSDTTFNANGTPGKLVTDIGINSYDVSHSITVQSNGKILVGGVSDSGGTYDFALARYNSDGSSDTTFNAKGTPGKLVTDIGINSYDIGFNISVQTDGKILVVGLSDSSGSSDFTVVRYNPDGSLDTNFGALAGSSTLGGTVSFTENAASIALDTAVAIADPELSALRSGTGDYGGATLNLERNGGANTQDVLAFDTSKALFVVDGANLQSGGLTFATYSSAGGTLSVSFTSSDTAATQALVNEVLSHITYANSSDAPPAKVQIDWTFDDGNLGDQGSGSALSAKGSTTVNITAVNDLPTGVVTIVGTPAQGQTLTAINTLADLDGLGAISYQWKADGVTISGATGSTLVLAQTQVDKAITVTASYLDGQGTTELVSSNASAVVIALKQVTGTVADGYIAGARLYIDANHNGIADADEDTGILTDSSGNFSITTSLLGTLIAVGGTNMDTGLANNLILTAPQGSAVINPVTTLIQSYAAQNNASISAAEAAVQNALGITTNVDLTLYDPLAQSLGDTTALAIQRSAAQVAEIGNQSLKAGVSFETVVQALAGAIQNGQSLDLSSKSNLQSILGTTVPTAALESASITNTALSKAASLQAIATLQTSAAVPGQSLVGDSDTNSRASTPGNDTIDGAAGTDTLVLSGNFANYQLLYNRALGTATVTDRRLGGDGVDTLKSVEVLQFADKTFDLFNPPKTAPAVFNTSQSFLFDPAYYLLSNPDLVPSVTLTTAFEHYKTVGAAAGDAPNPWFDPVYYANRWADLKPLNLDAATLFAHYNLYGVWEGRSSGLAFDHYDGARYLTDNPDVAAYVDAYVGDFLGSRSNGAIAHYIIYGAAEGRVAYDTAGTPIEQVVVIGVAG